MRRAAAGAGNKGRKGNIVRKGALAFDTPCQHTLPRGLADFARQPENEVTMAVTRENDQIVETAREARGAEPGPSVLALLTASTGLAVLILGIVWFVFFRT
jgi:hypothetical protein